MFKKFHLDLEKWEQIGNGQSVRLEFRISRQTGYFLKTKEMCHLTHTKLEQMPFKSLRYLIYFSTYEGKSEMVSLYSDHFEFSRQTGYVFENQRIVSPSTQDTWTNSVWIFKISHLDLEKWKQIGNGQSVRLQIRISRQTGYFLKTKEMCNLTHTKREQMPFNFFRYLI